MAVKPVKVLTDLQTKKQLLKLDANNNVLFRVSGSLGDGVVLIDVPVTASQGITARLYGTASYALNAATASYAENAGSALTSVYTTGSVTGSGLQANPITLTDPLIIGTITSSFIYSPQITGSLYGTASYAENAGNINTANIQNAYKRLRFQEVGFFDINGEASIELPSSSYGGDAFPITSFNYVNVSVDIKEDGRWINDMLAVQMLTSSGKIIVEISAPALTNTDQYKLIALNEDPNYFII
jgi:hypothetical protein